MRPTSPLVLALNKAYYDKHVLAFARVAAARRLRPLHDLFTALLPPRARILDAGCGTGGDAREFLRRGFRVTAIDSSMAMVRYCRKHGVRARCQHLQSITAAERYHAVWAAASLLHLPGDELAEVLTRLHRALRPGGLVYLSLWRGRSEGVMADGRFVKCHTHAGFIRCLHHARGFELLSSWRAQAGAGAGEESWLHFLARRVPA
jgi:SAM-dependent methyltransferase